MAWIIVVQLFVWWFRSAGGGRKGAGQGRGGANPRVEGGAGVVIAEMIRPRRKGAGLLSVGVPPQGYTALHTTKPRQAAAISPPKQHRQQTRVIIPGTTVGRGSLSRLRVASSYQANRRKTKGVSTWELLRPQQQHRVADAVLGHSGRLRDGAHREDLLRGEHVQGALKARRRPRKDDARLTLEA